ncbi:cation diffusion facilitator family transporter [Methanocaldococcus infernus ME]|uniref:Cation diffusion facilitator family transporter n=1 Tax=Methanocaldococcus infernus (strain DSM 11812 / JCM 15783 / ME) TaxID=573063 RepID=D5VTA3_METIM|nr:cation diffusion facilitator family transporter [Methanocaldococcus infernus]ADG13806.1 cation diffusion facilitator family transporter [Methanocaldococcus infernus ME]
MREEEKPLIFSIVGNIALSLAKVYIGYLYNSISILSDGIHSLSDVITSVIGYFGVKISNKPPDDDHPLGHRRFENIFALIIGIALIFVSFELLKDSFFRFISRETIEVNSIMLGVVIFSIIFKEVMTQYSLIIGRKLNNKILIADAYHHRSDVLSSIAVLIGLILEKLNIYFGDALAGVVVSLMILKTGIDITKENILLLSGVRASEDLINEVREVILSHEKVLGVHDIKVYHLGSKVHVDVHVEVPCNISAKEMHDIETELKNRLEKLDNVEVAHIHIDLV